MVQWMVKMNQFAGTQVLDSLSPVTMSGENIVCFAKDWSDNPTSANHVMKMLARNNRVLWLNSIATRTPNLSSSNDLRKIGRKMKDLVRGPFEAAPGLNVYSPIVLPFPHSRAAVRANRQILRSTVSALRRRLGMRDFQLWSFLPSAVEYVGQLGESLVVYYCTDEWSEFKSVDGTRMAALERDMCSKADLVFATSQQLVERKRLHNPETHLASHGVDHAHFSKALEPSTVVPSDVAGLPHPVVGFFGLLEYWYDIDLFAYLAERRPDWSIVVIGPEKVDCSRLRQYPNVHLLGYKAYEELPGYCKAFDVGLCPFVTNELTRNVNPIKLREYLSAGLPVVSTGIPEIQNYNAWCSNAVGPADFLAHCERVLAEDTPRLRRARSASMADETWERKVADLGAHIGRVQAQRHAAVPFGSPLASTI